MNLNTSFNTTEASGSPEKRDVTKTNKSISYSPQKTAGFEIMPNEHGLV